MTADTILVRKPTAAPAGEGRGATFDLAPPIAGETGGMVGNTGANDRKHIDELADGVDCAIVGLGTCGSCTTFTIKDSVVVEQREKPVVAIVTEEFEGHGHNVGTHLGPGDLKGLVLPYPLEARPEEELRAIADEFYPQVLAQLGVSA